MKMRARRCFEAVRSSIAGRHMLALARLSTRTVCCRTTLPYQHRALFSKKRPRPCTAVRIARSTQIHATLETRSQVYQRMVQALFSTSRTAARAGPCFCGDTTSDIRNQPQRQRPSYSGTSLLRQRHASCEHRTARVLEKGFFLRYGGNLCDAPRSRQHPKPPLPQA